MEDNVENKKVFLELTLDLLSELYGMICDCRRDYPELKQNLEPRFHLEDCHYRIALNSIGYD